VFLIESWKLPKLFLKIGKTSPCSHTLSQSLERMHY
jgi:hypothetical protein